MVELEIIPESIILIKLTDEEYFSEKYKDYISNSKLSLANPDEGGSKEKFNTKVKSEYSESFELGSAIHAMTLQPDEYNISPLFKPTAKLGFFTEKVLENRRSGMTISGSIEKASVDANYYSGKLSSIKLKSALKSALPFYLKRNKVFDNYIYLSEPVYEKYTKCIREIRNNYDFDRLLFPAGNVEIFNEYAIFCEVKVGDKILKIKGKLDNFVIDHDSNHLILNDLKSSGKPCNFFMGGKTKVINDYGKSEYVWVNGSFQNYRYYRQLALYSWLLQCAVQKEFGLVYKSNANVLVVETIPNFKSKVFPVNNYYIKKGINEFKNLLFMISEW